jgi:iron complex outermembrane receptor protein
VSYEAEYQGWWLDHRLRTRVAVFHNHLKHLISAVPVSPTIGTWANTPGVADIQGAEVGIEVIATSWLRGFANYSNQHTNQSITGYQRRGGPTSMASGGLVAEWENGLMGQITAHYVGAGVYPVRPDWSQFASLGLIPQSAVPTPRVGSYTLLNVRAGYRFWQNRAEIAVSAFNALNDQHREHPLGDILGSRVMGWFTLTL